MPFAPPGTEALLAARADERLAYPWPGLEERLAAQAAPVLHLVGYGSLLEPDSARRTVLDTPDDGHPPVLAWGARRLFDYEMSDAGRERYGAAAEGRERAALDVRWTGRAADGFNGRLLDVAVDHLEALRRREVGYDLAPVVWQPWDEPDAAPAVAFALCASRRPVGGRVRVRDDVLPCPPYLEICRRGARRVSPAFEQVLLDTTFLADGTTPLRDHLGEPRPAAADGGPAPS